MNQPTTRALNLQKASIFKLLVAITALLSWVIALGAGGAVILQNIYGHWQLNRSESLTIYLPPDADTTALRQLQQSLPALEGVRGVKVVGLPQLQNMLQPLIGTPENLPLPTVVEVQTGTNANRAQLVEHIRQNFPTAEVDDHQQVLGQVGGTVRNLQSIALALAGVMLALMGLMVVLTVRTGLAAKRGTLHLLIQLGATDAFLARTVTTQVTGRVLGGAISGTAAAVILLAVSAMANPVMDAYLTPLTWAVVVATPLLLPFIAALTAVGTTRGLLQRLA